MNISEIINDIVLEWSYRVNDGMPNPFNEQHITVLCEVLDDMGLQSVKYELIDNITQLSEADDKRFRTPELNKVITYKNKKGVAKQGVVGNLLRLAADQPGRKAAERLLPPEGSAERDAINRDLGSERQGGSTTPQQPKVKTKPDAVQTDTTPQQPDTSHMFKSDPAMAAMLSKEKQIQTKLAKDAEPGGDGDGEQKVKDQIKQAQMDAETDFKPKKSSEVNKEMPDADTDTFQGKSDIPQDIPGDKKLEVATKIDQLAKAAKDAKEKGEKAPNYNLCKVTIPGTNLYCDGNLGIPREDMPQFKGKPQEGTPAAKMKLDANGEVDTEPMFRALLKSKGVNVVDTEIPSDRLKATQSELVGAKVAGMAKALDTNPDHPSITAPIYVSRDGYVVDGHHRWAAMTSKAITDGKPVNMKVHVIDMDAKDIIPLANKFAEKVGIAAKKADANAEGPKKKVDNATDTKSVSKRIGQKIKDWSESEKEFFKKEEYKVESEFRRGLGKTLKEKAAGAVKSVKHGLKHETVEFKTAGVAVKNLFSGKKLNKHQKKALMNVGVKIATTALFGAAGGGVAHGTAAFSQHVASQLIPHVIGETILKGIGRAALFAGDMDVDADMVRFINLIADGIEKMKLEPSFMESVVDSYNDKTDGTITEDMQSVYDMHIKNPETGRNIKVSTALSYGEGHKVYPIAISLLRKHGISLKSDSSIDYNSSSNLLKSFIKNGFSASKGAPGSPGSMLNEIISISSATEYLNSTTEFDFNTALGKSINELKGSKLGDENTGDEPISGVTASDARDVSQKYGVSMQLASKTIAATRAAMNKYNWVRTHIIDKNGIGEYMCIPFFGDKGGLLSQSDMIRNTTGKVFLGNTEISKSDAIRIAISGGSGRNPSDTAIFVVDKSNGDMHMTYYSDKDNINAIVAQSSITAETSVKIGIIDELAADGKLNSATATYIKDIMNTSLKEYSTLETQLTNIVTAPMHHLKTQNINTLTHMAKTISKGADPEKYWKTQISGRFSNPNRKLGDRMVSDYLPAGHSTPPTDSEMMAAFINYSIDDSNVGNLTKPSQRIITDLSNSTNGPKIGSAIGDIRKKTIETDLKLIRELDKKKVVIAGVEVGIGTYLEANSVVDKLHLNIIFGGDGVFMDESAFVQESGGVTVSRNTLSKCIPYTNKDEMISHFEVGDEKEVIQKGSDSVSGSTKIVYAVTKDGKKYAIGEKRQRSKTGPLGKLQTVYNFHPELQKCLQSHNK
jgi:hypothetical protein